MLFRSLLCHCTHLDQIKTLKICLITFHYVLPSVDAYAKNNCGCLFKHLGGEKLELLAVVGIMMFIILELKETFASVAQEHAITTVIHEEN